MADITLAECNGNIWLVGGEQHVHDLLRDILPPDISVELISCDDRDQVRRLWVQNCGEPSSPSDPMMIHPAIAERVRRATPGRTVYFTQWSAMIDADALAVLRAAATWMIATPTLHAQLVDYVDGESLPGLAELSALRLALIEARLVEFGVDRTRLSRQSRKPAGVHEDNQRVEIEITESEDVAAG